jgi:tRNA(Arg) A34 adenosine deaminase TadA
MSVYTTLEPCDMCARLIAQGGVGKLVVAARYADVPEFVRPSETNIDKRLSNAGRNILLVSGIGLDQAKGIMVADNKRHISGG